MLLLDPAEQEAYSSPTSGTSGNHNCGSALVDGCGKYVGACTTSLGNSGVGGRILSSFWGAASSSEDSELGLPPCTSGGRTGLVSNVLNRSSLILLYVDLALFD
jgi:hypothetical protein